MSNNENSFLFFQVIKAWSAFVEQKCIRQIGETNLYFTNCACIYNLSGQTYCMNMRVYTVV